MTSEQKRVHGLWNTRIHSTWHSMVGRCTQPSSANYHRYGGRGIHVYEPWIYDVQSFYNHVSTLPGFGEENRTLDRIDNDGHYEPGNLRWATRAEQQRNRSDNVLITFNGKSQILADWSQELGLSYDLLRNRILRRNWTVERAFTTPPQLNQYQPKP
jgi:hypothetical protein